MTNREPPDMLKLAEIVAASGPNERLDAEVAEALGWRQRRVTRLGLNGRTPGSDLWFSPTDGFGTPGRRKPPRFTGPRKRAATIAALRAALNGDT